MSRRARKWLKEVWQAAARTSGEMNRLSPVTTPLGNRLVESYVAARGLDAGELQRALRIAVVPGYASRMVLAEREWSAHASVYRWIRRVLPAGGTRGAMRGRRRGGR